MQLFNFISLLILFLGAMNVTASNPDIGLEDAFSDPASCVVLTSYTPEIETHKGRSLAQSPLKESPKYIKSHEDINQRSVFRRCAEHPFIVQYGKIISISTVSLLSITFIIGIPILGSADYEMMLNMSNATLTVSGAF